MGLSSVRARHRLSPLAPPTNPAQQRRLGFGAAGACVGVRAGVPDVIAIHRGQVFAFVLKTEHGRVTSAQLQTIGTYGALVVMLKSMRWRRS
jgi:hypothetical protein